MSKTIDNTDDIIDVRDITDRVDELQAVENNLREEFDADPLNAGVDFDNWKRNQSEYTSDDADELAALSAILYELQGNGGDHQWDSAWYPATLIRDSYFETYMDEMLEDCGDLPKDLPSYLSITVNYRALQMDYTSTEIDGVTYWYR
jgi:hypothetical protein